MHRPYGVFDDLGAFVGRAYMPADHVTASSPVRSVGLLPYRKAAGGLESRPYGYVWFYSVGAVHRAALMCVLGKTTSGSPNGRPLRVRQIKARPRGDPGAQVFSRYGDISRPSHKIPGGGLKNRGAEGSLRRLRCRPAYP
mgnify:CR=1 FL=1